MNEEVNISNSFEINKALNEFEADSIASQVPKAPGLSGEGGVPGMVGLVMKWSGGTIKDQKTAGYILLGVVILMIIISLILFLSSGTKDYDPDKIVPPGIIDPTKPLN